MFMTPIYNSFAFLIKSAFVVNTREWRIPSHLVTQCSSNELRKKIIEPGWHSTTVAMVGRTRSPPLKLPKVTSQHQASSWTSRWASTLLLIFNTQSCAAPICGKSKSGCLFTTARRARCQTCHRLFSRPRKRLLSCRRPGWMASKKCWKLG